MVKVIGENAEKASAYLSEQIKNNCAGNLISVMEQGGVLIILPNSIANSKKKYGENSNEHLDLLNRISKANKKFKIVLNFDFETPYNLYRQASSHLNIAQIHKEDNPKFKKFNNVLVSNMNRFEGELSEDIILCEYEDSKNYLPNDDKSKVSFIINNMLRFNINEAKNRGFAKPVELLGSIKTGLGGNIVSSWNVSKINYNTIIYLLNLITF